VFSSQKKTVLDVWPENLMKAAPFENGWPPLFCFEVLRHPQLDLEDHPGGVFCGAAISGSQNMAPYNQRPFLTILEHFLSS